MERRDILKTLVASVAAAVSSNALAAENDHHAHHDHAAMAKRNTAVIEASVDCLKTGEACLAHCHYLLGDGDTSMVGCAQSVSEMLAVCNALFRLASQDSKLLPGLAKVAAEACANCEKECRKHEKKHAECKACADSCAACLKECKKLAA